VIRKIKRRLKVEKEAEVLAPHFGVEFIMRFSGKKKQ